MTEPNATLAFLQPVLTDLAAVADGVSNDQLAAPTPCSEYDVADLTGHIVGWLENFAAGFASTDGQCPTSDVSGVRVDRATASQRITDAAGVLSDAIAAGAADRPLVIAEQGGMPGKMALSMIVGEYLVHGWDLARATGQQWTPDAAAVTAAHDFLQGMLTPEFRGPSGSFGVEVPVPTDAAPLEKLLGFAGRDPNWTP